MGAPSMVAAALPIRTGPTCLVRVWHRFFAEREERPMLARAELTVDASDEKRRSLLLEAAPALGQSAWSGHGIDSRPK
eukprot:CAMPEP_0183547132 /NCGR_PEP_ID=MMETSP0371-20130417/57145_1 /TAXON_ID=268820 /ORGANISM="Peridinium aciculiferum, Strain PAER-2" /LENGTH=77 /DNA_ID=CAMNT_0025749973 /DNA_START=41 /DNA_END=271 /DNA_ORIENTATION=+